MLHYFLLKEGMNLQLGPEGSDESYPKACQFQQSGSMKLTPGPMNPIGLVLQGVS